MTIVEMLIALAIGGVLMGALFSFIISTQSVVSADTRRISTNQTVRSALEMIATDVRQAGEDMSVLVSPISISGSGSNKVIQVRRQISATELKVCANVSASNTKISVTVPTGTAPQDSGCDYSNSDTSTANPQRLPDVLRDWQAQRLAVPEASKVLRVFIYDPATKTGEFLNYTGEGMEAMTAPTGTTASGTSERAFITLGTGVSTSYPFANRPRIVILQEKQYFLSGTDLMMRVDGKGPDQAIAPNITALQATVDIDTSTSSVPNVVTYQTLGYNANWKRITKVSLSVSGAVTERGRTTTRTLSDTVFPRNVLSKSSE